MDVLPDFVHGAVDHEASRIDRNGESITLLQFLSTLTSDVA